MTQRDALPELNATSLSTIESGEVELYRARRAIFFDPQERYRPFLDLLEVGRGRRVLPVDNYRHSLQTATRAYDAGEDEETVVLALLHDMCDNVETGLDHGIAAALLLSPFFDDDHVWLLYHHGIFQNFSRRFLPEAQRNARERYRGHPAFEKTVRFCDVYDQASFDPSYRTLPIEAFEPLARRVLSVEPRARQIRVGIDGIAE